MGWGGRGPFWRWLCVATSAAAQAPAAPAQMNMADHRGALQGRVRDAQGAAVADTPVTAVNEENGAQFVATTDAQGAYAFGALPMGKYSVSTASAGLTTFRRRGVEITQDGKAQLDITLDAASAAAAAEGERQELLQKIATLEQRVADLETSTVLSEPETRVRRVEVFVDRERAGARQPGARVETGGDLPARAHLSTPDDQREDRCGPRGRGQPQRDGRRGRGRGHTVCPAA